MVETLTQGIGRIGPQFEVFAGLVMTALTGTPTTQAGVNLLGYPVAKVSDGETDDGRTVFEYSDRKTYFVGKMDKAATDLRKVLTQKPAATSIFLISGASYKPQIAGTFAKRTRRWKAMAGKTLHLWGREQLAEQIVDHLLVNERMVRRLSAFLPELQQIADEEAATGLAPKPETPRLPRADVDAQIVRQLGESPVIVLAGMAGLGKSQTAAAYAADHADDYDLIIWLEGREVPRVETLQALPLVRAGEQRNIAALLKSRTCLLIIDDVDPGVRPNDLVALCGPESRVILTQQTVTKEAYELPLLGKSDAKALLDMAGAPCPRDVFETIWASAQGHPLTLNLLRGAVVEGTASWADIAADCAALNALPDDRGDTLANRMLARVIPQARQELSVFEWAGQGTIGAGFLTEVIAPVGLRKLRAYGLTAVDRPDVVRLHDIVFAALKGFNLADAARRLDLTERLETHLVETSAELALKFWETARSLQGKLVDLVRTGERRAAFIYALLTVWEPAEVDPALVGDPLSTANGLQYGSREALGVIAVIEAIEHLFLYEKEADETAAQARLTERLPAFAILAALPYLSDREQSQIKHHEAKALKRLGKAEAAAAMFEAVLDGPAPLNESRLQLIDLYRGQSDKAGETVALVDTIFKERAQGGDVTYSVLLGLIERLPAGNGSWRNETIARHAGDIEKTIVEAANRGVGQAFRAFAPLGRFLSKEMPEMFRSIFDQLPNPGVESLAPEDRFAWAEIYAEAARLSDADRPAKQARALALYESLARPSKFHTQRRAELLIEMERPAEGEALIRALLNFDQDSGWLQRLLARARLAQGDPADALLWINDALGRLTSEHFRSEFLELRFDIRTALNDGAAFEDLEAAHGASQRVGERQRLAERLATTRLI